MGDANVEGPWSPRWRRLGLLWVAATVPVAVAASCFVGTPDAYVVVLAVHYRALDDVLARYGDELDGKIVVDIVNPVDFATFEPAPPAAGSTAQEIAVTRPNARVVKAFNTTFAGTLVAGKVAGEPLDILIASDDDDAKRVVSQLVADGGLRPIDAGPLRRARELEALGYLHIAIQEPLGTGFASTLKVAA